ncbi:restriction endonuclease subunit S [Paenimyroides aestuarii]|uniref:Restriction endonuclease subunit S n=1 Tax=Paenimyroides aestuarii TaxID=2968490 RepID=A0ABY5NST6_9FLAO|nr:restriction endonuclease subunit S [Paenimyroides aestuarii]UUV21419.1 restriction endonuclease subunit S [Paenimyroides aestuarii]
MVKNNWQIKKLRDIGKIISGGTPSTSISEYWNGDINWISPSDLTGYVEKKIKKGKKSITEEGLKKSSAKLMPKGSILFSSRAPIGYVVIADTELCTNQGFKSIIPNENLSSDYIYYFLKASKQKAESIASGTTFKEISLKVFSEIEIPVPPLETQHAIVSKIEELFSELDQGIADLKTAQEQLKVYRQSVLKHAFEGKLTNKNVKEGELPEGWEKLKIGDFAKVKGGKRLPKGHFYSEEQTQYPYIRVTDFCNQTVNKYKLKYLHPETQFAIKNYTISKNDVYISIAGTIGVVGTIPEQLDGANLTENAAKITEFNKVYNKFLSLFLSSIEAQIQIKSKTKITTQPKLSLYRILDIDVPIPSLEEQHVIVQEIESRLSVADKMEESIQESLQKAEALRQSILKKAFSGQLL